MGQSSDIAEFTTASTTYKAKLGVSYQIMLYDYGYNIESGENVYFNVNCVVLDSMKITIGNNVFIGPGTHIYTATHPLDAIERQKIEFSKPVTIGNDCWIGGNTVICPGVIIGNGCTIGAGAVVTKNIPDHSLAVGNPAKVIRKLMV